MKSNGARGDLKAMCRAERRDAVPMATAIAELAAGSKRFAFLRLKSGSRTVPVAQSTRPLASQVVVTGGQPKPFRATTVNAGHATSK